MKHYISLFLSLAMLVVLGACSKEDPFNFGPEEGEGRLLKSALQVELANPEGITVITRAATPTADDFTVDFIADGETAPHVSYLYSEMPEVVTLPVGVWKAVAHYGENASNAWESPYFEGSTSFNVVQDKITEVADPIVARLSNVRVSIKFDYNLSQNMSADSKVTVKVGESGTLDFTADDAERSGYFAYVENSCSLTATFIGEVEGLPVTESKVFDNVAPGSHYSITFRLHDAGEEDPGDINAGLVVDASVTVEDMNIVIDGEDDPIIEDDMRPVQGGDDPNPGPGPDQPGPDQPGGSAPTVVSAKPAADSEYAGFKPVDLETVNTVTDDLYCALEVTSTADGGIQGFTVTINSGTLTAEELEGFGLSQNLDLVNPGSLAGPLEGLGFPINVGGQKNVQFNITGFLPMLSVLGPGNHEFLLEITDANGTTTKSLKLQTM